MIFKEQTHTRIDDFDLNGNIKPAALLKLLENTASHHSNYVRDKMPAGSIGSIVWIITDWRVKILRTPNFKDSLTAETWIVGKAPAVYADRQLILRDAAGAAIVHAEAKHALLDVEANRIARIDDETMSRYEPETERLFEGKAPRLRMPESFEHECAIALRRSDIDYNGHVHNTAYLDFAEELLPEQERLSGAKAFRLTYRRALKYGDRVTVKGTETDGVWKIGIYSGDELASAAEIE